jgi:2-isopropylmalate synthase
MSKDISSFIIEPRELNELAHHVEAKLPDAYQPRIQHLSEALVRGADVFITSRTVIDLKQPGEPNVAPHKHSVSQTYLFLSPDNSLEVDIEIDGQHRTARAPATAFIPAGLEHSLRILRGTGTVISIVRSGVYE